MKRYLRKKIEKKWNIIDRVKYPYSGFEFVVDKFAPSMKIMKYIRDDIVCFYFRHGTLFLMPAFWWGNIGTKFVYFSVIDEIKKHLLNDKFVGKVGFQCCELEQLNRVSELMINKYGYKTNRKDGFIYVDFDYQKT